MSASIGLDLTRNVSIFTVPVAWFMAFIPHGYAVRMAGKYYDLAYPRNVKQSVENSDLDKPKKLRIARAKAASENALESIGVFAGGVLAANFAGVDTATLNCLSLGYLGLRVLYNTAYIFLQENRRLAWTRGVSWIASMVVIMTLWIKAGLKVMA